MSRYAFLSLTSAVADAPKAAADFLAATPTRATAPMPTKAIAAATALATAAAFDGARS
ncbi:hypothetical protein [Streptomyces endophytica]|uniref:Uncharacterized protein n=1 Tax=Streptomyces endophytica TaxID=2991496 RepID=A0ABY6PIN8_9ACTN|nr:hypothetical protein [Streptomyces endophytica]UZJ33012.1 hypothetical protein OJ254_25360 [Streptomyces endophytica]